MSGVANNRRTHYTKKIIREEFLRLLQQKDLRQITVTDIAEAADINRGTFYKYYKNPEDLLQHIESDFICEILANLPLDKLPLTESLERLLTIIQKNQQLSQLILANTQSKHLLSSILEVVKPEAFQRFTLYFDQPSSEELALYFSYFVNGSIGLIEDWLTYYPELSVKKIRQLLINVFETNVFE